MVPVFYEGQRIGRLSVDIPFSQKEIIFKKENHDAFAVVDVFSTNDEDDISVMPKFTEIRLPLLTRSIEITELEVVSMNTGDIGSLLKRRGAPYPSENFRASRNDHTYSTIYSWKIAEVTLETLEEIFDMDLYVPE